MQPSPNMEGCIVCGDAHHIACPSCGEFLCGIHAETVGDCESHLPRGATGTSAPADPPVPVSSPTPADAPAPSGPAEIPSAVSAADPILEQMTRFGIKEIRQPFESMIFGTCLLSFVKGRPNLQEHGGRVGPHAQDNCRELYRLTETEKERRAREAAGTTLESMRIWPNWIKNARFVAGRLQELEKGGRGPSPVIRKEFPSGKVEDLAPICRRLVDLAFASGLQNDKVNDFKRWISKFLILVQFDARLLQKISDCGILLQREKLLLSALVLKRVRGRDPCSWTST